MRKYFILRAEKIFFMKILLLLPKFHEKTLSRPGDIKIFRTGRMYMYTLPPFMDAVFSEERQLMKWVRIFHMGILWVGIFPGDIFQGGVFPGGIFLEPLISLTIKVEVFLLDFLPRCML